jgi:hypothetical protein
MGQNITADLFIKSKQDSSKYFLYILIHRLLRGIR